ncbi:MAG: type II toxin-antitoxin system RelE/ParE family toxin [Rhodothermales bacterium]
MICTFANKQTEELFLHGRSRHFPGTILTRALDKLRYIDAANELDDLRIPPGNRLKRLQGKIANTYGIRVNRSWRICFIWQEGNAYQVELNNHYA